MHLQNWTQRYRLSSATALLFNFRHIASGFSICIFQVSNAVGGGGEISQPLPVLLVRLVFPPAHTTWRLCPWNPVPGAVGDEEGVPVLASATLQWRGKGTYLGVQPLLTFTTSSHEWRWTRCPYHEPPRLGVQGLGHTAHTVQPPLTGLTRPGGMRTTVSGWQLVRRGFPEVQLMAVRFQVAQAQPLVVQPLCTPSRQPGYGTEKDSKRPLSDEAESPN